VLRYEPAKDRWAIYTAPEHFPYPNARVLTIAPDGAPWVHIGYDHVYRFDGQAWRAAYESGGGQWVCGITFDAAALPWIATCGGFHAYGRGLAHFSDEQWIYADASAGLPDNEITAVAIAPDGTVAAGSDRGVAVSRDGEWRTLHFGPTLSRVTAVVALPDGSATFGFGDSGSRPAGGGLARYEAHGWSYEGGTQGLPVDANVHLLSLSLSGEIWAAGGCGLYRRSAEHWETLATCEQIQGPITTLAFDPSGAAWIGTPFALYRYDSEELRVFEGHSAIALAVDRGGTVWALADSLNGGALMTYDGATWQDRTADMPGTPERPLTVDADGALWAGLQEGGLARRDGVTWWRVTRADGLPFEHVVLLVPDADGVLWAASGSSVARLVNGAWQRYDIPTPGINALSPTPNGSLWLATDSGAFLLKP
jgi:ligand-binding sensor domain-containing protein